VTRVRREGVELCLEDTGRPGAPPLVLIHGLGDDHRLWERMRPYLAVEVRLLAYDLRGHGASTAPTCPEAYTMAEFVADLLAVLDAGRVDRALLVGFSLGGAVALHFALAHPDRVAAIAAINANAAARDPDEESTLAGATDGGSEARALLPDPERRFAERLLTRLSDGARMAATIGRRASIAARAHEIAVPVWLIASDRDPGFARRSANLLERLRHGHRVVVPGAGHAIMIDQPAALAAALGDFVARSWPAG
jgi:pimeloyl-ACP methyl ester carboxylesterase